MKNLFKSFASNESGATAIEYGLIAAGIATVIVGAVYYLGGRLDTRYRAIGAKI